MTDVKKLRSALATYLGNAKYKKFVQRGIQRGRMAYWQERAWEAFVTSHPEFAVGIEELTTTLRVCHLHGDELQPDATEIYRGHIDYNMDYINLRNQLFPHAAQDTVSSEDRSFEGDKVEVFFCPSCRTARADWEARRQKNWDVRQKRRFRKMMEAEQHALVQQLGQAMSEISESCYCAGWMDGTEYCVPELCRRAIETGHTQHWGHGKVTLQAARELSAMADKAGCWANTDYNSVGYDPFQPFPIPDQYIRDIEREQP